MQWPGNARRRTLALLGSLCLFLSAVEYLIPRPLPFMRIGLANVPLLLALDLFSPANFVLLALIKVLGQGILSGALFSYVFLFSLAGTFSSAMFMYLIRRVLGKHRLGFTGIGCAGAMISNAVQLVLARYFVFGAGLRFLIPPFLLSGFISGAALGLFCETFCRRSRWYAEHTGTGLPANGADSTRVDVQPAAEDKAINGAAHTSADRRQIREKRRLRRRQCWDSLFKADELCIAAFIMALLFLFNPSLLFRTMQFVFFYFLAWVSGKKNNVLITAFVMAGIVFCSLLVPYGKLLAELGPLQITQGSLLAGLERAVTLEGLLMLSGACVKPGLRLPGSIGALLAESFRILEQMRARWAAIRRGHIIEPESDRSESAVWGDDGRPAKRGCRQGGAKKTCRYAGKCPETGPPFKVHLPHIIEDLDRLMLELETAPDDEPPESAARHKQPRRKTGLLLLAGMTALTAVLSLKTFAFFSIMHIR